MVPEILDFYVHGLVLDQISRWTLTTPNELFLQESTLTYMQIIKFKKWNASSPWGLEGSTGKISQLIPIM
jgi:hypothetical protein